MKTIVITGSTRGIGLGLTKFFLAHNCNVVINGTSEASVSRALSELSLPAERVVGVAGDVSDYATHERLADKAVLTFGQIDVWINNAGIQQEKQYFYDHDPDLVKKVMEVNLLGVVYGSQVAYKVMNRHNGGFIYNMEGLGSDGRKAAKQAFYGTSKRAIRYLTHSMALETEADEVKVGTLSPGMVATDLLRQSFDADPEEVKRLKKVFNILADEVDDVVAFLGREILKNQKNNQHIEWLTTGKVIRRFLMSPFVKRHIFED